MSCEARQGATGMYCIRCETCWDMDDTGPACKPFEVRPCKPIQTIELSNMIKQAKLLHPGDIQGLIEVAEQVADGNFNQAELIDQSRTELRKIYEMLK